MPSQQSRHQLFEARVKGTGERVVLKLFHDAQVNSKELIRQAHAMHKLRHVGVLGMDCVIEEVSESPRKWYVQMPLLTRGDMSQWMKKAPARNRQGNEAYMRSFVKRLMSAVSFIHSKGVIHRDLKVELSC